MNGLLHLLIARGYVDRDFVAAHTVGYDELESVVRNYPPGRVSDICGIPVADLERAAEWIGTTDRFVSTMLQGFYQSVVATASSSLVNSVHLLRGAIGRRGAGPLLMAGQPSAMSNREAGADGSYPAYRNPENASHAPLGKVIIARRRFLAARADCRAALPRPHGNLDTLLVGPEAGVLVYESPDGGGSGLESWSVPWRGRYRRRRIPA